MSEHPFPVEAYIEAHHATVLVDEASFDADGNAIDAGLAEKTGAVERAAFIEFVTAPCRTADDVQAKLDYILNGSVGIRDTLLDCLIDYGDDLGERFLRSLVLDDAGSTLVNASRASRVTCACACEEAAAALKSALAGVLPMAEAYWANPAEISEIVEARRLVPAEEA